MILGGLVDVGVPLDVVRAALRGLPLSGWTIEPRGVTRCGLAGTKIDVEIEEDGAERGWTELESILRGGALAERVLERSLAIFRRLIEAEAAVHGRAPGEVHLHEAGAVDAIVDIVGACAGLEHLRVDEVVVSRLTTGFGEVRCAHGTYPVPAPATAELIRGVPVRGGDVEAERLTPTGAAVLTVLADRWGALPPMRPLAVGHGAGERDLEGVPNLLRMILGEADPSAAHAAVSVGPDLAAIEGEVAVLECTVDDATPQALAFAAGRLLAAGALDVATSPVTMKKGRPGHRLTVLARPEDLDRTARQVLRDTTTLGVRFRIERRFALERELRRVETAFGPVGVKVAWLGDRVLRVQPEYEDCAALAERHGTTLERVRRAALEAHAAAGEVGPTDDPQGGTP
jgi:uncharacterized protein (TIGR00299 family) protein